MAPAALNAAASYGTLRLLRLFRIPVAVDSTRRHDCLVAMPGVETGGMMATNMGNLKKLGLVMGSLTWLGASLASLGTLKRYVDDI